MMRFASSAVLAWVSAAYIWQGLDASRLEAYLTVGIAFIGWMGLFRIVDRVGGEA